MNRIVLVAVGWGALWWPALALGERVAGRGQAPVEDEDALTTADEQQVTVLLAQARRATEAGDGAELALALGRMAGHDNPEFREVALAALAYRVTREDREAAQKQAQELGITNRRDIEALVEERAARVQAGAAWVLAAQRGDDQVAAQLLRTLRGRGFLNGRPEAAAAVIEVLGKLGDERALRDVERELKRFGDPRIQRASIRYFGWIRTKDRSIVRFLCEQLDSPEPGDVDSPTNPPASYWEERWRAWNHWRRDLTWSLRRITGQTFQPAEGTQPSDRRKAMAWLSEHGAAHGIR